ncbi:FUN14 domain-containing protein 1A-like isoform X2 [Liolophura sinensis]|uniref:FUN14 domain-containing protein 1A-like isoform X2 n=1 Tax=Liolophura sinensis TaxID=3198878 RepID=UPI003158661F
MPSIRRLNDDTFEVLSMSDDRSPRWLRQIFGDVSRQSTGKQLAIGGVSGWCAGYLFSKIGKVAAAAMGTSMILLQIAQYNGYIQINWNRVERSVTEAKERFDRGSTRNLPAYFESVHDFLRQNMFVAGGFAGGFLLGIAT